VELFEAINTTRAMRRLDPARPVAEADIWTILAAASKAPSGGNSQPVRWIVVTDTDKKQRLGAIYGEAWKPVSELYRQRTDEAIAPILRSADYLGEHMGEAPVLLLPTSRGDDPASVYPACQNLFLAARALGLGTALTTVHRLREAEVRAVLGVPDDVHTWAMIPLGYPLGRWGEAQRRPVAETTYWNAYGETQEVEGA
jgi:nitroreductase